METPALLAPDATSPPRQCRARVLDLLRAAGSPLGGHEVADRGRLHPDTARFHLDGLVEAALAIRERQARATPGQPGMAYRAADDGGLTGERRYRLLAEMLTALITGMMPDPGKAALEAGREWGSYRTEQSPPTSGPSPGRPIGRLVAIMGKPGFAPQVGAHGRRYRLPASVPFREVAQQHQDVVWSLHLGLMQGALAQMRAPLTAGRLDALTERGLCIAHLTARDGPGPRLPPADTPWQLAGCGTGSARPCRLIRRAAGRPGATQRRICVRILRLPSPGHYQRTDQRTRARSRPDQPRPGRPRQGRRPADD